MIKIAMRTKWCALAVLVCWVTPAMPQIPDKFTNLKVLPKDISRDELLSTMRGFSFALGVRCEHCHADMPAAAAGKRPQRDFASDEKEAKKTARVMLQMVEAINRDYISKVPKTPAPRVQCVTCHHGLAEPRTLNSVLAEAIDQKGIDAATAMYRDLREKYYGGGQYDFGETPLNQLTESLLAQKKNKEALAIAEMNFAENHTDSVWSYHTLAMAHQANGQTAKALEDYRQVLKLHPEDDWAKQQIASLSGGKS